MTMEWLDEVLINLFSDDEITSTQIWSHSATINKRFGVGMSRETYIAIYSGISNFIENHLNKIHKCAEVYKGNELLEMYVQYWSRYSEASDALSAIFVKIDNWTRGEIDKGRKERYMVYMLSMVLWKRDIFDTLEHKIIPAMLELVRLERTGHTINKRFISAVVENLVELGLDDTVSAMEREAKKLDIYKNSFEKKFIEATRDFYTNEVSVFHMENGSCTDYLIKVETRIQQEDNRVTLCLHSSTGTPLSGCCNDVMITKQLEFIQAHFGRLLMDKMDDHLARMYRMCLRVENGLPALRKALKEHVQKEGLDALERVAAEAFNDPKLYMSTLWEVHERYQGLVDRSFSKEPGFMKSLDSAAIEFVNKNAVTLRAPPQLQPLKSSELLSRYCDQLFRKSAKMPDENEMDDSQKKVMTIFKYLEDKDVFLKFYTQMLSRRLITEHSASVEAESAFIQKLTDTCGYEFTTRLTKMFQDIQVSKDLTSEFKEKSVDDDGKKFVEFNAKVLTPRFWPCHSESTIRIPKNLSTKLDDFEAYYVAKHQRRRLTWLYSQCRGEVTTTAFKGKKYVFGVTTPQMCTLLLFNEQATFTAEHIMEAIGMDGKSTKAVVGSLVKNQVLKSDKALEGDEVPLNATITLNDGYTNKKVRVDLSKMTMKAEPVKETDNVQKDLDEDRKNMIAACIVRIMKVRKQMSHSELIHEAITQLSGRFKPTAALIKVSILDLINNEYLTRENKLLKYVD
ncbi:hypothetical protein GCK72_003993 [Caenorhabditis remanei]|uniref:Cullin family profile domain-containing protein n=1 Tax=Caenorhabditis remanei TaxID=31234 RepID=A0A6A5HA48_CAERE|nr:hypothetical protein GCK72_003993 [Caenorhabditis remanei]KAF1764047.1 hypothetical protein GCK72_003993 [Caenorhabditis remanei]